MNLNFRKVGRKALTVLACLLVLLCLVLPAVYTNSIFGYLPILVTFFLLLVSALYLWILRRNIVVDTDRGDVEVERGETVRVDLGIRNRSFLVCNKAKADIYVQDYLGEDDSRTEAVFSIDARNQADFGFDVQMEHLGQYTAGIRNMHIYGLLGLLSIPIPIDSRFHVLVLPKVHEEEEALNAESITDSPNASSFKEGDGFDYTGVREYEMGDSMKKIHWKLSAHSMDYMTKVNEVGLKSDLAVILDMAADALPTPQLLSICDGLVETAASVMLTAEKQDIESVLFYPDKDRTIRAIFPKTQEDYAELIRHMMPITPNPKAGFPDAQELLTIEMAGANQRANVLVVTSRVTDGLLDTLTTIRNQQRNPLLYCILPTNVTANERKEIQSRFLGLDDAGVPYRVLTAVDAERRDVL
ncbi:MAG: DUF58 domain-containing protein [Clostridia bacterium]|nr:DUF58 domain-containing protein [Clostridia bacterium]